MANDYKDLVIVALSILQQIFFMHKKKWVFKACKNNEEDIIDIMFRYEKNYEILLTISDRLTKAVFTR